ncbi:hypothetical protein D3C81_1394550 [compost metagenome]
MQSQGRGLADVTNGCDFIQGVDAADFGGLSDADAGGLGRVYVADFFASPLAQSDDIQLGRRAVDGHQLRAVGKELGRAAFIVVDMAGRVAVDVAPGWCHRTQAQGVGGGAGGHEKDLHVALEDLAELALDLCRQLVGAIGTRLARTVFDEGLCHLRRCTGDVVT